MLLAAGASSRLGQPKQLLVYKGGSLISHAIQTAKTTGTSTIVAVVRPQDDVVIAQARLAGAAIAINEGWQEGMAASIRTGVLHILDMNPELPAIIILVCDQPFVTPELLTELWLRHQQTAKPIVASRYKQTAGTPALFDCSIFGSLLALKGDTGAKKIMLSNPDQLELVDFALGAIDIDTGEDYADLQKTVESRYKIEPCV